MFVSPEHSPSKKTFQKPNILRRKTKITAIRAVPSKSFPVPAPTGEQTFLEAPCDEVVPASTTADTVVQNEELDSSPSVAAHAPPSAPRASSVAAQHSGSLLQRASTGAGPAAVAVEAFISAGQSSQYKSNAGSEKVENLLIQKWQIDFENAEEKIIIDSYDAAPGDDQVGPTRGPRADTGRAGAGDRVGPAAGGAARHTAPGDDQVSRRPAAALLCPARSGGAACARPFAERALLARHLRDEHAPEDAGHACALCPRRFFLASGLRAHQRSHRPGPGPPRLACSWPGCGRAFRQPCRLREHARAHTGDKPYPCRHPGCGWAFRTASKLLRHARRHTGERRHACWCGRAFHRREHLREHQARHARRLQPDAAPHACAMPGCTVSFANMSSLYLHTKKAHREPRAAGTGTGAAPSDDGADTHQAAPPPPPTAGAHAARTHCTWPLAPPPDLATEEPCAVRSDLFLAAGAHDDSQPMSPGAAPLPPPPAEPPHVGLGLLDLMQEELMYADAVDESSFQVLLLSEELA